MKNFIRMMSVMFVVFVFVFYVNDGFCGSSSGGSRSSSSRSSIGSSSRSYSKPAAPVVSKPSVPSTRNSSSTKSIIGGTKSTAPVAVAKPVQKLSPADMAMAKSVKQKGPTYKSRDEGTKAYLASNPKLSTVEGKNSQFNSFKSEPSTRPSYIPQSTNVNGRPVNITYNQGYGGYGYMDPMTNVWMSAMAVGMVADMAINHNMAMSGYRYYGDPFTPVRTSYMSFWGFLWSIIILMVVVGGIVFFFKSIKEN